MADSARGYILLGHLGRHLLVDHKGLEQNRSLVCTDQHHRYRCHLHCGPLGNARTSPAKRTIRLHRIL